MSNYLPNAHHKNIRRQITANNNFESQVIQAYSYYEMLYALHEAALDPLADRKLKKLGI